jgi:hypothetical protein
MESTIVSQAREKKCSNVKVDHDWALDTPEKAMCRDPCTYPFLLIDGQVGKKSRDNQGQRDEVDNDEVNVGPFEGVRVDAVVAFPLSKDRDKGIKDRPTSKRSTVFSH